ncbi:penicillin-binding protein 1A [Rheinheimera sp. F8]|uniref:penicillin-binding protein 1A n=1 Tax=Rheinheimera sp. F8 TaxID=1763998 RepID=UPI000744B4DE|nr:penicillin-binding protein 1A [Rheinheimera sp. F8]ALZ75565.1 penicillin-sensitive transpeptidase [Rheinheimera sp. F8]ALZ77404.1 penicillin-sensitive transpeptidase [Rheinheimera sp. F8]
MSWLKKLVIILLSCLTLGVLSVAITYLVLKNDLPSVETLKDVRLQTPMRVFSQDGELISQFGEKRRIPLKLNEMPPMLIKAVLATEDSRFYEHPGIDLIGVMRAASVVATTGDYSQGASTITQQLARLFFLSREKKIIRKVKEAFLAIHIEELLSKDEILELYLNRIELGQRAFGVGAAAQVYFGKNIQDLTLSEIAIIAGLPQAPSVLNPVRSPSRARARRNIVLGRMLAEKYITQQEYDEAIQSPIISKLHGAQVTASAPYLAEMVRQEVVARYGEEEAYSKGFQVFTTVDARQQTRAVNALQTNLHAYDERHGFRGPLKTVWPAEKVTAADGSITFKEEKRLSDEAILAYLDEQDAIEKLQPAVVTQVMAQSAEVMLSGGRKIELPWDGLKWARAYISNERQGNAPSAAGQVLSPGMLIYVREQEGQWRLSQLPQASSALVAMNPKDGAIRALVGGYSFSQTQFNRVTQANRQVGSNIKPFIYSAALEHGYTLASVINDAPIHEWDEGSGQAWRPKNSPEEYDGPIRLREALAKSKNVVSVRLIGGVGIDHTINHLAKFGFHANDLPRNQTLALGSASLTPLELVTGYAVFANGGYLVKPYVITKILDDQNNLIYEHQAISVCDQCEQLAANTAEADTSETQPAATDAAETVAAATADPAVTEPPKPTEQYAPRVISAQNAFLIAEAMKSAIWGGPGWNGTAHKLKALKRRDISGKTGTTNDVKDAWFSGFTPDLVITSWVGFDDSESVLGRSVTLGGESGATSALPSWLSFAELALENVPEQFPPTPTGIVSVRIDRKTGLLTQASDDSSEFEYFMQGTEPTQYADPVNPLQPDQQKPAEIDIFR